MTELHPSLFDRSNIPADTRVVAAIAKSRIPDNPGWTAEHARALRDAKRAGTDGFPAIIRSPRASTYSIPGPAGEIMLRVISSSSPRGVYIHIHGGGWYMGGADLQDYKLEALADDAGVTCVSVEYRLAPENRFPAAVEDCVAAVVWLAENAETIWGTRRLVLGGDSAGAHLAALTLLGIRSLTDIPVDAAHFIFGFFDLSLTPGARQFGSERSRPRTADLRGYVDAFVGPDRELDDPDISPLYADLSNLCPALFVVGTDDALLEDSLFMHMRWMAAGNPSALQVYPGAPHNFVAMPCRAAVDAHEQTVRFLRQHLDD
ncbi:alpha/beta hydrolase [Rhodococcus koreensis]|jgi:acetyl esterase/lipase|uniref:alpha/beta hydrolase n=1 Tax=Rhodococcus koreensis TaxID=99653 RepID=UPI001980EA4E|nr:alpha/beta hydrolase [Rhodococcus koreensis]QSE86731.1 alpha/beta hydrolase [Rhodococcus koreensis]